LFIGVRASLIWLSLGEKRKTARILLGARMLQDFSGLLEDARIGSGSAQIRRYRDQV
jgi:hypothetical protein